MIAAYRTLFAAPGSAGFSIAGLLARLALPMTGIGIITLLAQLRGSYALAGAVSAAFVLSYALLSPQLSRLADNYGQSRILSLATATSVSGLLLLAFCTWAQAPAWTLFLGAGLAGFMPSISAMIRARWTALYRGRPQLQSAYSLETVLDELSFIIGPALSVALSVSVLPQAGLLMAALLLSLGALCLLAHKKTEPPSNNINGAVRPLASVLSQPGVGPLVLMMVAMGLIVGTVDVASVAYAQQLDRPAAASLVLACYAAGSCLAGLMFGAWPAPWPLHRLLLLGGAGTAVTTLPLLLANSIPTLSGAVFLAGLFFAPTMIVAMSLLEKTIPEQQLTEGMAWLLAGLNGGVAAGAALSGRLIDAHGAQAGFTIALGAGALAAASAWLGRRHLQLGSPSLLSD